MKLKQISISGMHKVTQKEYTFNDDVIYFVGPNGAGKSTILEAIQLCLLGYIPGYQKTKESILKHASGKIMSITLMLDSDITITRTWMKSGTSSKSDIEVITPNGLSDCPEEVIKGLLGDIELPVFDFNEFKSMTANKLKDWFISFLPSSNDEMNIEERLNAALGDRQLPTDELMTRVKSWIDNNSTDCSSLELVRLINANLKEEQSFVKGQIAKLQGTIESLIYYDDVEDVDKEGLEIRRNDLNALKGEIMKYESAVQVQNRLMATLKSLESSVQADSYEADPRIPEMTSKVDELIKQSSAVEESYSKVQQKIADIEAQIRRVPNAAASCPYTNEPCDTAAKLVQQNEQKLAELNKQLQEQKGESVRCNPSVWYTLDEEAQKIQREMNLIKGQYDQLTAMKAQITEIEKPSDRTVESIDIEIRSIQEQLVKAAANEKYDAFMKTVTADKFAQENDLEVLKIWTKFTDANGLQTELMNKPFEDLGDEMSTYLTQMFGAETTAQFNLAAKANSFSFGLIHNGSYIEFDYLSSGEKCLFTLALILCILNRSKSQVRTILVDDILDHLDVDHATYLFKSLRNIEDVQFILAGVKECSEQDICKEV